MQYAIRLVVRSFTPALAVCALAATSLAQQKADWKPQSAAAPAELKAALESLTGAELVEHIRVLASDEFEGRGPGTPGEEKTVAYLTRQLKSFGLSPGNPDGTFVQKVPLAGFQSKPAASFAAGGKTIALEPLEDYVAVSRRFVPEVSVKDSDVVFVGYGVVAPEYGWDDYKGVDVKGKTIVMLINDPAVPDPKDPTKLDDAFFKGRAMTYYGRWTYKYEIASEKGAAAAVIVHETGPAGYPFEVVSGSWGRENFDIQRPDGNAGRVAVESWITNEKARELFAACGKDLDALKVAATKKDFAPVALGAKANFQLANTLRKVDSQNVVARLEGGAKKDELVVYTAHWDHLGRDAAATGDGIYNGALDNASGCASVLEIAQAFTKLPAKPERSILFLFVTAEEKGLLGAKYYASNPLYPLEKTLSDINIDGVNPWGRTKDVISVGFGNTTLDDLLVELAARQGRAVKPDAEPEKGFFYRSDHFEFAKRGVPALDPDTGVEYVGKPAEWGKAKKDEYTERDYHKPSDQLRPEWDFAGAIEDLQLFFQVGYSVAQTARFPEWKPGTEFKAKREAMLKR